MFKRRKDHSIPELNTTSTADISFMLLIFFLVTTSMETEKGLQRKLPPQDNNEKKEMKDVNASRVATLQITDDRHIICDNQQLPDSKLEEYLRDFIDRVGPEHIIEIKAGADAKYDTYFHLQNILSRVYGALREKYAQTHYHKSFTDCSDDERKAIREKYPQHLSEQLASGIAAGGQSPAEQEEQSLEAAANAAATNVAATNAAGNPSATNSSSAADAPK